MHVKGNNEVDNKAKRIRFLSMLASILAGIFFLYVSVSVISYGSAFSMSSSLLHPLIKFSETLAFSLAGFLTIGVPLSVLFGLVTWLVKRAVGVCYSYLVVLPLVLLILLGFLRASTSGELDLKYLVLMTMQYLPLMLVVILLSTRTKLNARA